jgi:hypothetical protein
MENENELPALKGNFYERLEAISLLDGSLQLRNAADVYRFSLIAKASGLVRRELTEKDVFMIVLNGVRLRLDPLEALASSYVVNNRISLFGEVPRALVEASGLLEDYEECFEGKPYQDDFKAVVVSKRKGHSKPLVSEFSVLDAKEANLWDKSAIRDGRETSPWQLYKKDMLMSKARTRNLKGNFPDVLRGTNIISEHEAEGFDQAKPAREAKVVEPNFAPQFKEVKEAVKNASPTPEPMKMDMRGRNIPAEDNVGRPSRSEVGPTRTAKAAPVTAEAVPVPTKASSPVEEPPVAPPGLKPQAPATDEATPYWQLHKRLAEEKISHDRFLRVMWECNYLPGVEPEDISAGMITLSKLPEKGIKAALFDWDFVLKNLPPV